MERFGARLVANGYPILPIMPGTKKPGRFRSGALADYPDWTRHGERADHRARARHLARLAGRRHRHRLRAGRRHRHRHRRMPSSRSSSSGSRATGSATRRRSGSAGRRSGCWSTARPSRSQASGAPARGARARPAVRRLRDPPRHRPALRVAGGEPRRSDSASLPEVDEATVRAFLDEALGAGAGRAEAGSARRRAVEPMPARRTPRQARSAAIREALAWIPNADLDYDSWVRIGLALKGALGDAGGDLFAAWSAQSGKDDADLHRQDLGEPQARAHRRRHDLPPRHGAGLEARPGAGARRRGAGRSRASGGRAARQGAGGCF